MSKIAFDVETGRSYDVTDPAHPVEVNPVTGDPVSDPIPTSPVVATDIETGKTFDVSEPARPKEILSLIHI